MASPCQEPGSSKVEWRPKLLEIDVKRGEGHNMLLDNGVYAGLLRAALQDRIDAVITGPNCRTRSVLRHYPRENAPRPVRAWNGEEYGLADLTPAEKNPG